MTSLRVKGNAHSKLAAPAKLAGTEPAQMRNLRDAVPVPPGLTTHGKDTMPMDDPDKVCSHLATHTKPPLNLPGNGLAKRVTFMNAPTPMMKLMKDITGGTAYPVSHARKPMRASGSAPANLTILAMKAMMLTHTHSSAIAPLYIPRLMSMTGRY